MFFSNYEYDIIIIGGGIAGLFTAYKLRDTGLRIILLESSNRLGGRIHTVTKNNISFHDTRENLMQKLYEVFKV